MQIHIQTVDQLIALGPTSYFIPNYRTIQIPKASVVDYDKRAKSSVVGEFNHAQTEAGKKECSNGTSYNSLKAYRPKWLNVPTRRILQHLFQKYKVTLNRPPLIT